MVPFRHQPHDLDAVIPRRDFGERIGNLVRKGMRATLSSSLILPGAGAVRLAPAPQDRHRHEADEGAAAERRQRGDAKTGAVVEPEGVEPSRLAALDPKSSASANSATSP